MNAHLSDEQWAAAVLGENSEPVTIHLRECLPCREELESFAALMGGARVGIRGAAEQPEAFWRAQRERLAARMAGGPVFQPWKRLAWAAATATLIILATTLLSRNVPPPPRPVAQTDPDDALMLSVQQSIRSELPQALRPAALLTQEIDRAAASR